MSTNDPRPADITIGTLTPAEVAALDARAPRRGFRLDRDTGHWRTTWRFHDTGGVRSASVSSDSGLLYTLLHTAHAYLMQVEGRRRRTAALRRGR